LSGLHTYLSDTPCDGRGDLYECLICFYLYNGLIELDGIAYLDEPFDDFRFVHSLAEVGQF
jgi:hypothetical protein